MEVVSKEEFEQAMKELGLIKVYDYCEHEVEFHYRDHPKCPTIYDYGTKWIKK